MQKVSTLTSIYLHHQRSEDHLDTDNEDMIGSSPPKEGHTHQSIQHRSHVTLCTMLDELGEADWELVSICWCPEGYYVAFLRRYGILA